MRRGACLFLAACYLAVPLAFGGNNYVMGLMVSSLIVAGVAVAWALLGNLGGMVSFGHAAFFGVGAYASALLSMKLGVPVLLAIPLAGLIAVLFSIAMLPALRLSGPYFALAILAYAQIFRILATEMEFLTHGSGGISQIPVLPTILGFALASRVGQSCCCCRCSRASSPPTTRFAAATTASRCAPCTTARTPPAWSA